ncbi:MAG: inorganic phosphate transporter [Candidatus Heimdallarchaeaceae archaeon]
MEVIIIVLLILMIGLGFGIGSNDETMATLYGSRVIKTKYVIGLAAVLAFIGVMFMSERVGRTIGENLLGQEVEYSIYMLLAIIISTTIWLIVASITGAPISTTHSVVGAVFGVALVWSFSQNGSFGASMDWGTVGKVALGWVISPILGFIGAFTFKSIMDKILSKMQRGLDKLEKIERIFGILLILVIGWTQISRAGNDSANALGIMYGLIETGQLTENLSGYLVAVTGLLKGLGIIAIGRIVIKNVGNNLISLKPSDAFSIELSTGIVLFVATLIGLPISGSQVLIFSVVGAGMVKGERPDKKTFVRIIISWIITFPVAAALSALIYGVTLAII